MVRDLEDKRNTKAKQRTHISWLKDGNKTTRYFMAFASARKKSNRVKELLKEDREVVKEGEGLTNYVRCFFQELFTTNFGDRLPELIDRVEPRVTSDMRTVLSAEFT